MILDDDMNIIDDIPLQFVQPITTTTTTTTNTNNNQRATNNFSF